ncbi:hypothetical protein EN866_24150 [Mesorhizobium sp. M2D.F.Ca.ET.223.01.1.1]|uniref:hypothetical protein n=1 Tax=Mesorhizobium sp. M2D.F.Ca.ET.223.01.1.1 TaxID=2563940 RepID=UPI001092F4FD|nr:hypothetical protein [Mesorhizobium sp. M2D.F.Ca.ET.223.01.1.1]TGP86393.1 hypothetical protein EN864_24160 [bacterium M00.F.Ca.ET.221.01.1.1]TGR88735.1 hypothetical protein EN866_24150 [Mesorhizobium sp. M2D.F.Ca.ET.223.01.1.1]
MTKDLCHIHNFQERDVDLLLAEELRVNDEFAAWFMERVSPRIPVLGPAFRTRISVVQDGSEADVIACFRRTDGGVHRVFIEDKITAPLMSDQLERYQRRAAAEQLRGESKSYSVVLFAPAGYGSGMPNGVLRLTFEEAAVALELNKNDHRAAYKAEFLRAALPRTSSAARDAHVVDVEPYLADWWEGVYAMLEREFPRFFVPPTRRYPRSVYFAPRTGGMADYLRVDFKGHLGEVDLAIKNVNYADVASALKGLQLPGSLVENGKSTAIRIGSLEKFVIADGFEVIETKVRAAYEAAAKLLTFWKENRERFDSLALR